MRKHPLSTLPLRSGERGVALLLTLAIITLVTLLLIAFAVSMRVENAASKNFNDLYKARELAKAAIDQAVATIRQATPLRTQSGTPAAFTTYVTFPGTIYTNFFNGTAPNIGSFTLYSCPLCTAPNTTNLNAGLWITGGTNGLGEFNSTPLPDPSQINVGWIYVATNGAVGPAPLFAPLIGRFAYWVDDEASKINVNTAGLGAVPADAPYASAQKELDLQVLYPLPNPFLFASTIKSGGPTYPRATYPYTTIEEIKREDPGITAAIFDDNRFSVTTYSDDANYPGYTDDRDVFDRQRMIVSSLNNPNDFNTTVGSGSAYDRLADLALMQVCSAGGVLRAFEQKYTVNGLKQIIANIMGYQIKNLALKWPPDDGSAIPAVPAYLGLAKTPYISEVQVKYDFIGTAPDFQIMRTVTVELYYMYNNGTFISRAGDKVTVSGLPTPGSGFSASVDVDVSGGGTYSTGSLFFTSTTDGPATYSSALGQVTLPGKPVSATYIRHYAIGGDHRLDFAQMTLPQNSAAIPGTYYQDCELTGDPAVNELSSQWTVHKDGDPLRLGVYTPIPVPSDMSKSVVMRGDAIQSIGELGYIHHPTLAWTYLTLQPQPAAEKVAKQIPDWAMLDLFTVDPAIVPKVTTGRININSFINPGLATPAPSTKRLVPLEALLNSLSPPPPAVDIYDDPVTRRAGGADSYGMKDPALGDPIFDTIGEICEITTLIPVGAATEKDKEATIRRIANLITVRSNTFTIWVMAQSIKQPPGSTFGTYNPNLDLITGEVRAQAVVERYVDTSTTPAKVKFRTRYFRYL